LQARSGAHRPSRHRRQANDQPIFHRSLGPEHDLLTTNVAGVTKPLSLSVEADAKALAPMRHALQAWLTELGANDISDIVLAVDEAVANAIEHAGLASTASIAVEASVVGNTLQVEICDNGIWKEPTANDTRGRGLMIINAVMDGVAIERQDDNTRVVMSRNVR
jgi:anti-sigma regulatory factor (Ser/Thr protein kinase)